MRALDTTDYRQIADQGAPIRPIRLLARYPMFNDTDATEPVIPRDHRWRLVAIDIRCQSRKHEGTRSWQCQLDADHQGDHTHHTGRRHWE